MQGVDGRGDDDAPGRQEPRVPLDRPDQRAADAAILLFRQHEDGIQAALRRIVPVRAADGGAADDGPVVLTGDIEVHLLAAAQEIRPRLIFDHLLHKGLIVDLAGGDAGGKLGHADNSVGVRGGKTADVHGAFLPCVCS